MSKCPKLLSVLALFGRWYGHPNAHLAPIAAVAPLARAWTVEMGAADMKFFGGFSLGVFAPRQGKKSACVADDHFRRNASGTTLSACFLECSNDAACMNVFVEYDKIAWIGFPTAAVRCTLLGAIANPSKRCRDWEAGDGNAGTLISRLPGSRPMDIS